MRILQLVLVLTVLLPCSGQFLHEFIVDAFFKDSCLSIIDGDLCQNSGICIVDGICSKCQCVNGWSGEFCDECHQGLVNDGICHTCAGVTCLNDGVCMASRDGISCVCEPGFYGEICELSEASETVIESSTTIPVTTTTFSDVTYEINDSAEVPTATTLPKIDSSTVPTPSHAPPVATTKELPLESSKTTPSSSPTITTSTKVRISRLLPTTTTTAPRIETPSTTSTPTVSSTIATEDVHLLESLPIDPIIDSPTIQINLTSSGLSPSSYLEKLRVYTNLSIEFVADSDGHLDLAILTDDKQYQITSDVAVAPDSLIAADVTIDFTNCATECRFITLDAFAHFLNSPEALDVIGVPSVTAAIQRKRVPHKEESWLWTTVTILVILGVFVFIIPAVITKQRSARQRFIISKINTPVGLPQYKVNAFHRPSPIISAITPLHDELKYSMEPVYAVSETSQLATIDTAGQTPLHAAIVADAEKPDAKILADLYLLLPTFHANIDQRDFAGNTALHLAIKCRRPAVVDYLLQHGANPNVRGPQGTTPLSMAIVAESLKCFQKLLAHKDIDPNVAIDPEDTPLKMVIMRGSAFDAFFDALLADPRTKPTSPGDIRTGICRAPVHVAVLAHNVYALKELIKRDVNLNAEDREKTTPLLLAIQTEALDMAKILIAAMKPLDFYHKIPLLSPLEQAKERNFDNVIRWMKTTEAAEVHRRPRKRGRKPTASTIPAKKTKKAITSSPDSGCAITPTTSPVTYQELMTPLNNQMHGPSFSPPSGFAPPPMSYNNYQQSFEQPPVCQQPPTAFNNQIPTNTTPYQPVPINTFNQYQQPMPMFSNESYQPQQMDFNGFSCVQPSYQTSSAFTQQPTDYQMPYAITQLPTDYQNYENYIQTYTY